MGASIVADILIKMCSGPDYCLNKFCPLAPSCKKAREPKGKLYRIGYFRLDEKGKCVHYDEDIKNKK